MFDARDTLDSQFETAGPTAQALPPAAARCLRAAGGRDHAHAEALRRSCRNESSRATKRARSLSAKAATEEAKAADLARETR